jgi:K+-sensing histidine kinase KdpD
MTRRPLLKQQRPKPSISPTAVRLGLSIARAIVNAHGGPIFAENNRHGPGATGVVRAARAGKPVTLVIPS